MASDNLNQVGKHIKRIKDTADYASKKVFLNKRIERTRDVFDTVVPFEMEFKTQKDDTVYLDLKFNKPPPQKGCNGECFSNNCNTYTFTDGLDHIVDVGVAYIPGTIVVFRNRTKLEAPNFVETDPENGLVYVQGSTGTVEITVCYVSGDCNFDASNIHQYYGTFTFLSDGYGTNGMLGGTDSTFYSDNTQSLTFPAGSTWRFAIGMITAWGTCGDADTGHQMGAGSSNGWGLPHQTDNPLQNLNLLGYSGTQYYSIELANTYVQASLGGGCHIRKTVNVIWYFDEISYNMPQPESGQTVVNDKPFPATTTNSVGQFYTSYPYVAGTLIVFVNGVSEPITETDPNTGLFTFVTAPTPTSAWVITCKYVAQ